MSLPEWFFPWLFDVAIGCFIGNILYHVRHIHKTVSNIQQEQENLRILALRDLHQLKEKVDLLTRATNGSNLFRDSRKMMDERPKKDSSKSRNEAAREAASKKMKAWWAAKKGKPTTHDINLEEQDFRSGD